MQNIKKESYLDRITIDYTITKGDEIASSIIQMVGFGFGISAMVLLIVFSALKSSTVAVVSFALYGAFQTLYYTFSTLHHSLKDEIPKKIMKIFEQCSHYLMFIGIAIPFTLVFSGNLMGKIYFGIFIFINTLNIMVVLLNNDKRALKFVLNSLTMIVFILFFIMNYRAFSMILNIWLAIGFLVLVFGLIIKEFKGIFFSHAISHLCYVFANLCLFFGFLFEIV